LLLIGSFGAAAFVAAIGVTAWLMSSASKPSHGPAGTVAIVSSVPVRQSERAFRPAPTMPAAPPRPVAPPAAKVQATFDDWIQNFEQAKTQAAQEKKDILILFDGSDWCGWSIRLAYEVLFQAEFRKEVLQKFVLVLIDFPRKEPATA